MSAKEMRLRFLLIHSIGSIAFDDDPIVSAYESMIIEWEPAVHLPFRACLRCHRTGTVRGNSMTF